MAPTPPEPAAEKTPVERLAEYEKDYKSRKLALQRIVEDVELLQAQRVPPKEICVKEDAAIVQCMSKNTMTANPFVCQAELDAYVKCVEDHPVKRK